MRQQCSAGFQRFPSIQPGSHLHHAGQPYLPATLDQLDENRTREGRTPLRTVVDEADDVGAIVRIEPLPGGQNLPRRLQIADGQGGRGEIRTPAAG